MANEELDPIALVATRSASDFVAALGKWAALASARVAAKPEPDRVAEADAVFKALWEKLIEFGMIKNTAPYGMLAFSQGLEVLTHKLGIDAQWKSIHKGAHYYNMGLVYYALNEVDRAFKFFLMADEEDAANKGAQPGDLFRHKNIFLLLRARFITRWIDKTQSHFHDHLTVDERAELLGTAVAVLRGRYLLARCQLGVMRACNVGLMAIDGVQPPFVEYLMCVEDLALLTEAVARMFTESVWVYTSSKMLGEMLKSGMPLHVLGFQLPSPKVEIANEPAFRAALTNAGSGDRSAIAAIVKDARNQSAHATPFPDWSLDPSVLNSIIFVQLDFITTILAELKKTVAPPTFPTAGVPGSVVSALAAPSGTLP